MNKVVLLGRLGNDAKCSVFENGTKVTKFSLATTEKYKSKEETSWHNVDIWGDYGSKLSDYLIKGKQVLIEGRIQYSKGNKNGVETYFTTIVADTIELLGDSGKKEQSEPQMGTSVTPRNKPTQPSRKQDNEVDDDLPF